MKNTRLAFAFILIHLCIMTFAQSSKKITGRVVDEKGELLVGVNIMEVGTQNGTLTGIEGTYSLTVKNSRSTLKFSYIGFDSQEVIVGSNTVIDVTLKESKSELEEVVVVGYGSQRRISTIGSQSNLKLGDIKQPTASLSTSLAGRLAGVVAVQRSGEPGKDNADIWIRGISTMGSSSPLVLVDGVERSFNNIDPEDIESFTILKDASATAVYGVRGANGVILIKTKPGIAGKPSVSVDYYESVRDITDKLDAVGNTTAAIGKGFAIGSAALTALSLFVSFAETAGITKEGINILDAPVVAGLFIGGMLPFMFSALTMSSVGKAANKMIEEVRRQFKEKPGILKGTEKPDYKTCVGISTQAALHEMIIPGVMAVVAPLLIGFLLGVEALGGMLAGALVSGVMMAIFMANAGGAWDNAKKYIEGGFAGGKGSDAHKAAVVGDTVGDPFKDTSGPSINILIKLMTIVSLVFAAVIAQYGGILF